MRRLTCLAVAMAGLAVTAAGADEPARRLYDGFEAFVPNPSGAGFTVSLDIQDINHVARGPAELLVKIYAPDGRLLVREVVPDDGIPGGGYQPASAGWDHEAWYYATCYSRGLEPAVRWSLLSDPARLAAVPKRLLRYPVPAGPAGAYRVLVTGVPDHFVTLRLDPVRPYGLASTGYWLHGRGDQYRRSYLYVPRGATKVWILFLEMDWPASRSFVLRDPQGQPIELKYDGALQKLGYFAAPGQYDDQVLTLDVSPGPGDFLAAACFGMFSDPPAKRPNNTVNAVFAPDAQTARALQGGAIYHDGRTFWHPYQVRFHDWLRALPADPAELPADLPARTNYVSPGSHQTPARHSADRIMHSYPANRSPLALRAALRDMANGLNAMGPGDVIAHGPMKNLAYEMGCYSFFYHRPAWRILQQSDAPEPAKAAIREFIIQVGDRLAFCRTGELVNGNALASLVQALRYCAEASGDPLQKELFDAYWDRFADGGFGDRAGIGPSGGIQESFGYDENYGSYVLRGWQAVLADLGDRRFADAYAGVLSFYSYVYADGLDAAPWSSRTAGGVAGGTYDMWQPGAYAWKGIGGSNLTASVNGANEFFAARRPTYYAVTYHGRLSPTWVGEGFHGQVGYGGGMLCQVHVPAKGQVIAATLNGAYGGGMHPSQWRGFHIHSVVGTTEDGQPLVSANSEHVDARLATNVVTSSGEVRQSSVQVYRRYEFREDSIVCGVRLEPSAADGLFSLYGGWSQLRGRVREAYEMIPFADATEKERKSRKPKPATRVFALNEAGRVIGPLGAAPVRASAVEIDRVGYGCRVEFEQPMPVMRGSNSTVLVRLVDAPTNVASVALTYRLKPYIGPSASGP